jgi:hypothetical protein
VIYVDSTEEIPNNIYRNRSLTIDHGYFIIDCPLKRGVINDYSLSTYQQAHDTSPVLTSLNDRADWT